jgi:glutamyl-tRNA reductase
VSVEVFCIGLSHKTAPVAIRERLTLSDEIAQARVALLAREPNEVMVLSTCNRVEIYAAAPSIDQAVSEVRRTLEELGGPGTDAHLYEHRGEGALVHLFRVAASLDSMVVGEPQILGQVKDAFEAAQRGGTVRSELVRVCSAAFSSAKRVRTETGIGRTPVSMAAAAVDLARKIFGSLAGKRVLLVGAGEMAEVAGRHLASAGVGGMVVANRTRSRAEALAADLKAAAVSLDALDAELVAADLVVCSTASPVPIFTRERVAKVLKPRRHRPLFMVDLAVPRDVAPDVNTLDGVYTYDVDDIQKVVAESAAARSVEAAKAEVLVAEEVARFVTQRSVREGVPVLAQLRAHADEIAQAEIERSLAGWAATLDEKQQKGLRAMAQAIVSKLLHHPSARLRAVGVEKEGNRLAGAAAELFGLDEEGRSPPGSSH